MPYKILADITVVLHLFWIIFLMAGALVGVRYAFARYLHLLGLGFAVVMQVFGWYCPLTYLEVWLRSMHGPGLSYTGSFIAHYAEELVYIDLSRGLIFGLTLLIIGVNGWAYFMRGRKRSAGGR